jgi:glycosyltransferase involved in cell wall biosynthesis
MKIAIDASWALYERAGVGRYTHNLVKALLKVDQRNEYVLFFNYWRNREEREKIIQDIVGIRRDKIKIIRFYFPVKLKEWLMSTPFAWPRFIKEKIDIFHAPYFTGMPKYFFPNKIVTIHDLAFMHFPEHHGKKLSNFYLKKTKEAVKLSKKVVAVSLATKRDLISLLDVSAVKIAVVPEGKNLNLKNIDKKLAGQVLKQYLPTDKYILFVGTLEPRKNLVNLLKAYALLPHDLQKQYRLVLVGQKGWQTRAFQETLEVLNLRQKIVMPGFIPDEHLPYFYAGASVFVYPSFYEGFGLPVLEAMACGAPVITSKTSSMPEVAGRAGLLIDPESEESIAEAMKKVLTNQKLTETMKKAGLAQAKKFSWERAAAETQKVYENVFTQYNKNNKP